MKILCATDFSPSAQIAARAAARFAAKSGAQLYLAHAAHLPGTSAGTFAAPFGVAPDEVQRRRELLQAQAAELRALGAQVVEEQLEGLPDEVLLARAAELGVELLVIGPIGERAAAAFSLGSVALRVIKGAPVPVLVVREEASFEQWLSGARALRVLVGVEPAQPARAALDWLARQRTLGALELAAGCIYQPDAERTREATLVHERALTAQLCELTPELSEARVRVAAGWGRVAEHLLDLARDERADLIVIGTHRRTGFERWLRGSVSLDIVGHARGNVLTVPLVEAPPAPRPQPREIRSVLVPVDLSELSERAVRLACTLLPRGGSLQLLHVVAPLVPAGSDFGTYVPLPAQTPQELAREHAELEARLRALVPGDAGARGIDVHVEVLTGFGPAEQVARAAERLGVDLICLSTHGRSGLSKALLGSVAQGVVRQARVPVVVVPPPQRRAP